jgi:AcrR family transcriptional regulator
MEGVMEELRLPRRERQKLAQRQGMLAAALELFSQKGYRNVSMHEIAEKAEFAIGTLYKFFSNKETLYEALILDEAGKFHDALTKGIDEQDKEIDKLRNYVTTKGQVFRAKASMIRLYFAETQGASFNVTAGLHSEIREQHDDVLHTLAAVFESGIKSKQFRKIADPYHLAIALDGLTNAFLFRWLGNPERHPYPEDPDTVLNILFKGLLDR